jgi:multidrug efflux system membrane fusion protein
VSEATTALRDCSLQAPFSGWIIKRTVDVGSFVGLATNGFTIASTETVKAVFGIPDTAISRVKLGQRLNVSNDALGRQFPGRVTAISAAADPKSRVFSVEVMIPNPANTLKAGMIASLAIEHQRLPQFVLAVPISAVVRNPQTSDSFAVMVAQGDSEVESVRLQPVELGSVYGNMIGAISGIHSGERVVTTGVSLLKDGDSVRIIP